jgi:homoserine O-acetyltransferase
MAFRVVGLVSASLPKYLNSKVQLLTSVNLTSSANEQLQFQTASQPNSREDVKSPNFSEATFKGMQSHFPCLTKLREKETSVSNTGLEGMYGEKLQGYKTFKHQKPFRMKFGGELPELQIAYEEWGELNEERNNTILIHTGLSGSSHAKSSHSNSSNGWWEKFIGPGAPIDTNKFYVVCSNVLGGCYGSR